MKIGILLRENDNYHLNKELVELLKKYNLIPIGLIGNDLNSLKNISSFCNGFILQGGDNYNDIEIEFIKYLYDIDKPVLGICLGMQMMAISQNGYLGTISNHMSNQSYFHSVLIDKNSLFYKIVRKYKIFVNSRHHDYVIQTDLCKVGFSENVIEVVEDKNKRFFIGVQWHPESIPNDINTIKLIKYYISKLVD